MEEEITEEYNEYNNQPQEETKTRKGVVVPGEIIVSGDDYLPGEGTRRDGDHILAAKFGIAELMGRVVKVISLTGTYISRRNNAVIGIVESINMSGWSVNIDAASSAFLPLMETPRFINQNEMSQYLDVGDVIIAKIWSIKGKGIDLSIKNRGFGKLIGGFIFKVNPNTVPRIIGREGSMVSMIKEKTNTNITVGQNGWVWIKGDSIDNELRARKAIETIADNVHLQGLTDKMEEWFNSN